MKADLAVTKLRTFSLVGGISLILLSTWASIRYDASITAGQTLHAIGFGVAILFLPAGAAHAKFNARRAVDRWRAWRNPELRNRPYVTSSPLERPAEALDAIQSTLSEYDHYDEIRREEFSDGPGLTVVYSTYHTLFVRTLASGRLVVNGDSQRVKGLVEAVDAILSPSLEQTSVGSVSRPQPIDGIPRAILALCLAVLVVLGTGAVVGTAYPSDAYNPVEKTVLVSLDLRFDIDPTMSKTQLRLAKASFLVSVLDEKSVEIAMVNSTDGRARHASDALEISDTTSRLLQSAQPSSPDQLERIERIEADLDEAERGVASVLTETIEASDGDARSNLSSARDELRRRATTS